jgi:hypothetical protein
VGDDEDTLPGPATGLPASVPALPDGEDTVARGGRGDDADAVAVDPEPSPAVAAPSPVAPRLVAPLRIAVAGGAPIGLDAPVRIGRSPAPPRIPERVVLVTVPSPGGTVSSSHLEVRQSGPGAVLRDLGSLNGSKVEVPRSAPRLLARGDSMVVPAGTRIALGDGVVVEVLPPEGEERS